MVEPNDRVNDDLLDEIVEDIPAVRRAQAAAFGFDGARIVADLRHRDAASGRPLGLAAPETGSTPASGSRGVDA
jgi:hypothetical protein